MPRRRRSPPARSVAKIGALALAAALASAPAEAPSAQDRPLASPPSTPGAPPPMPPAACPLASEPARARDLGQLERVLGAWGDWLEIRPGRRAWRPRAVDPGWLPYYRGCWRWGGESWSWVTDEPWGDVTYHFGRWTLHAAYGWLWVPGRTWGPAWVAWRRDSQVVGWAPLPPAGAPSMASWTFVHADDFQGKWVDTVAVARALVPALLLEMRAGEGGHHARSARSRPAARARVAAR